MSSNRDIRSLQNQLKEISTLSLKLSEFLEDSGLKNNEDNGLLSADRDIMIKRAELIKSAESLVVSLKTPDERLRSIELEVMINDLQSLFSRIWSNRSWSMNQATLRWLYHFQIPRHVPASTSISYEELASVSNTPVFQLKRIIRFAITRGVFAESAPDHVAHSPMSSILREGAEMEDYVGFFSEYTFPSLIKLVEMTEKWGDSQGRNNAAFNIAFDTEMPMYQWLEKKPLHTAMFRKFLKAAQNTSAWTPQHLVHGFDWASLGNTTVVDIGGGNGYVAIALAKAFPKLRLIVQDLEQVVKQNLATGVPKELEDRVELMVHNFFTEQPIQKREFSCSDWCFTTGRTKLQLSSSNV